MLSLGGGNPSQIPEIDHRFRARMEHILRDGDQFERLIGHYGNPQGHHIFIEALAEFFTRQFGWSITAKNIAITNGSQAAFFSLFNLFAGEKCPNGKRKKILLPLSPEYIGYGDSGLSEDFFIACAPKIEWLPDQLFKYHLDFERLNRDIDFNEIGAICVSRPTNPTGNVLSDEELMQFDQLALKYQIPLIIDGAYGMPFPHIIFTPAHLIWNENIILSLSLSKLGLPGVRTGIVVAHETIIKAMSGINAILNLAPNNLGAVLALDLVKQDEMMTLSQDVIRPFYQAKAEQTLAYLRHALNGINYLIHKPEGAFFLWIWFKDLPISSQELYWRLKAKGVLIVPGHYFFPGLPAHELMPHRQQCIRLSYTQNTDIVEAGIDKIAETLHEVYKN
jgi:valine--pyruvate aminotransferase